jgi:hypothetical protein
MLERACETAIVRSSRQSLALVAQLDRAPDFESGGRGFESLRARDYLAKRSPPLLQAIRVCAEEEKRATTDGVNAHHTRYEQSISDGSRCPRISSDNDTPPDVF